MGAASTEWSAIMRSYLAIEASTAPVSKGVYCFVMVCS